MFNHNTISMKSSFDNEILFDDVATLENKLGEGCLSITSVTGNCDCSNYTSVQDDEDIDTSQSS